MDTTRLPGHPPGPWATGQRVVNEADPSLGIGTVLRVVDHRNVVVRFHTVETTCTYNIRTAPLRRFRLAVGQEGTHRDGTRFRVNTVATRAGRLIYRGEAADGSEVRVDEVDLADRVGSEGPVSSLLAGQITDFRDFELREAGWHQRAAAFARDTHGLVGARVRLLPHQFYIAHKIARREVPRVLLADEVGLGKTIEAGLIFSAMRALGRADRVLVLTPESLVHQWLAELFRRFSAMFSLLDAERCAELDEPRLTPFDVSRHVICSLDFLVGNPDRLDQARRAAWDLVIVDEAHHLEWSVTGASPAWQAVQQLGQASSGLLLLTATPMREGYETEFGLLRLVDPDRFHDFEAFQREHDHLRQVARLAQQLVEAEARPGGGATTEALATVRRLFPHDAALHEATIDCEAGRVPPGDVVQALVDRHGTGRVLIRNRRERLQGFPGRTLHPVRLEMPPAWRAIYDRLDSSRLDANDIVAVVSSILNVSSRLLRGDGGKERLERTTLAAAWRADPRVPWLLDFLRDHADDKIVLICSGSGTVSALHDAIREGSGLRAAAFHENLTVVERDRQAAWFAARDGAQVLLCSEIGGEGRNFQFSHHLVLFDLPVHPDTLEQRIGRLDRIGQDRVIDVYALYVADTPAEALFAWLHEGMSAFEKPVHGAEQVMRALQNDLLGVLRAFLPSSPAYARRAEPLSRLLQQSSAEVTRVRQIVRESVDTLVDLNSFDEAQGRALVAAIEAVDADTRLEQTMERIFDRFGVIDEVLDRQGRRSIRAGDLMFVDSFPGLPPQDALGATYRRDLALAREDLDFLSSDHPLVEGALALLLDQAGGRASVCTWLAAPERGVLLQCLFVLEAPGPAALELNRYLPVTPMVVTVDHRRHVRTDVEAALQGAPESLQRADEGLLRAQHAVLAKLLPGLAEQARRHAAAAAVPMREQAVRAAREALEKEQERLGEVARVNPTVPAREIAGHATRMQATLAALARAEVRLDAVRLVVMVPA